MDGVLVLVPGHGRRPRPVVGSHPRQLLRDLGLALLPEQPAAAIVRVQDTHCGLHATGAGTVAVIDTGVDPTIPPWRPVLTQGYDFTRNVEGGSERADVDQATAAVLDGIYGVNQATAAVLDQATAAVLDDDRAFALRPRHHGRGDRAPGGPHRFRSCPSRPSTPAARATRPTSSAPSCYATRKGAKVLNMSFSRPTPSRELKRALDYATGHGRHRWWPPPATTAVDPDVPGRLRQRDRRGLHQRTTTSARRSPTTARTSSGWPPPGEGVITTYPWGSFAAAWGTSFSTPSSPEAAALLVGMEGSVNQDQAAGAIAQAQPLTPELGYGRLDLFQAVNAGRNLWPNAPESALPDSCDASGVDWSPEPQQP